MIRPVTFDLTIVDIEFRESFLDFFSNETKVILIVSVPSESFDLEIKEGVDV